MKHWESEYLKEHFVEGKSAVEFRKCLEALEDLKPGNQQDAPKIRFRISGAIRVNERQREVTPLSVYEVPQVLEVHEVPSEEVRMVPEEPTATKVLFA